MRITNIFLALTTVLAAPLPAMGQAEASAEAQAAARRDPSWAPPRTPWGHPDLQGIWTTDDMRGVPQQRAEEFGTRPYLSDDEFAERETRREGARAHAGPRRVGHLPQRGRHAHLRLHVVGHRPAGRPHPSGASSDARGAALDAGLVRPRAVQHDGRLQSLRSLHHARRRSARSRRPSTATARASCRRRTPWPFPTRWFTTRASSRSTVARRFDEQHPPVHGRLARPLRRQHARHRERELHRQDGDRRRASQRAAPADRALHAHRSADDRLRDPRRRSADVGATLDDAHDHHAATGLRDLRVLVPRGQPRDAHMR